MRTCVYIDGSNFYHRLKACKSASSEYRFSDFICSLLLPTDDLLAIRYYIGRVQKISNNNKSAQVYRAQQQFLQKLKKQGLTIITGKIQEQNGVFYEKGVDVKIAIDMVEGALENAYEKAILISSDGDIAPAVLMVRKKGKQIINIGFQERASSALAQAASSFLKLDCEYLSRFL